MLLLEALKNARQALNCSEDIAYISRASSQQIRKVLRDLVKAVEPEAVIDSTRVALIEIAAKARFELDHPTDMRDTAFSLIEKKARETIEAFGTTRWRHKKRGTTYTEIGRGKFQISGTGIEASLLDMEPIVIYRSEQDGSLWARPVEEFEDGRFEKIREDD